MHQTLNFDSYFKRNVAHLSAFRILVVIKCLKNRHIEFILFDNNISFVPLSVSITKVFINNVDSVHSIQNFTLISERPVNVLVAISNNVEDYYACDTYTYLGNEDINNSFGSMPNISFARSHTCFEYWNHLSRATNLCSRNRVIEI